MISMPQKGTPPIIAGIQTACMVAVSIACALFLREGAKFCNTANNTMQQFKGILARAEEPLVNIARNTAGATQHVNAILARAEDPLVNVASNIAGATQHVNAILARAEDPLVNIASNTAGATQHVKDILAETKDSVVNIASNTARGAYNVADIAENVNAITGSIATEVESVGANRVLRGLVGVNMSMLSMLNRH
ncbi:MAG: hypothetical protein LBR79_04975 [Oscillospiraceae bacterium]|jgi:ABC-type transporter Mla subunit MlaD|nr:hypothetical protein [Oscillospiraceae bacterium]